MASPIADIEGKYEILAKLSEGGMGAIYQVRHRLLEEIRVVKVLRQQHAGDDELRLRFAHEARAAIRLRHPNVVQIFDFSVDDQGNGLIVMENIDGIDFEKLVRSHYAPSMALGLEMARQALRALGFLHQHGFVHRDVSPDNLMLTLDVDRRPLVKLIDLGIAKRVDAERQLTTRGSFLGKFRYASPEHFGAAGHDGIEPRSDLYSFGVVLYELLTKSFPMSAATTSQLIAAHLMRPPRDFAETDPENRLPHDVRQMLLRSLAKGPEGRFQDAESWIAALDELRSQVEPADVAKEASEWLAKAPPETGQTPGSATQGRFDHIFGMETTPRPTSQIEREPARTTPGGDLDALVSGARTLFELGQTKAARRQLETLLGIAPDHPDATRLLSEFETGGQEAPTASEAADPEKSAAIEVSTEPEETEREAVAVSEKREPDEPDADRIGAGSALPEESETVDDQLASEISDIERLIGEGRLTEADRHLFQLAEEHPDAPQFRPLQERLQAAFDGGLEVQLQALLAEAESKIENDDYPAALALIQKAEIMAPEEREIRRKHLQGVARLKAEIDARESRRGLEQIERHVVRRIQSGKLAGLRDELARAKASYGQADGEAGEMLDHLDRLVDRTVRDRLGTYVAEAGVALENGRVAAAVSQLRDASELAPDDPWIARQLAAAEKQLAAQRARDEADASLVGRLVATADGEGNPTPSDLPPNLVSTLAAIEQLRLDGDNLGAWKQMLRALERFGEIEVLLEARRSLAESILDRE
ncbi:MAG: protein kinase [Thermoanaerobaculia bacterium]|nr:protein kinase [Thermoanaerobaculia bacterium]